MKESNYQSKANEFLKSVDDELEFAAKTGARIYVWHPDGKSEQLIFKLVLGNPDDRAPFESIESSWDGLTHAHVDLSPNPDYYFDDGCSEEGDREEGLSPEDLAVWTQVVRDAVMVHLFELISHTE